MLWGGVSSWWQASHNGWRKNWWRNQGFGERWQVWWGRGGQQKISISKGFFHWTWSHHWHGIIAICVTTQYAQFEPAAHWSWAAQCYVAVATGKCLCADEDLLQNSGLWGCFEVFHGLSRFLRYDYSQDMICIITEKLTVLRLINPVSYLLMLICYTLFQLGK